MEQNIKDFFEGAWLAVSTWYGGAITLVILIASIYIGDKIKTNKQKKLDLLVSKLKDEIKPKAEINETNSDLENKITTIEKLGKLKEQGLLTEEEFAQEKKKILG